MYGSRLRHHQQFLDVDTQQMAQTQHPHLLPLSGKEKEALVIFTESTRPGAFSIGTRYIHSPSYFTDGNVPSIT